MCPFGQLLLDPEGWRERSGVGFYLEKKLDPKKGRRKLYERRRRGERKYEIMKMVMLSSHLVSGEKAELCVFLRVSFDLNQFRY